MDRRRLEGDPSSARHGGVRVVERPSRGSPRSGLGRHGPVLATLAGWTTVLVGLALVPLPGPGGLVVVAGLRLLAPRHPWAARWYEPLHRRAVTAARLSVSTWPRLALTAIGPAWLLVLALAYTNDARIPAFTAIGVHVGPTLPFDSLATTFGLWSSAAVAAALVVVGALRWGPVPRVRPSYRRGDRQTLNSSADLRDCWTTQHRDPRRRVARGREHRTAHAHHQE